MPYQSAGRHWKVGQVSLDFMGWRWIITGLLPAGGQDLNTSCTLFLPPFNVQTTPASTPPPSLWEVARLCPGWTQQPGPSLPNRCHCGGRCS